MLANDIAKYVEYTAVEDIDTKAHVMFSSVEKRNLRGKVIEIVKKLKDIIVKSNIVLPNRMELELSHHYGIDNYFEYGAAILNCINREYCKKLIILLPSQNHPVHHHILKEETFHVLYGNVTIELDGQPRSLNAGEMLTIERNSKHSFSSENGCIFEEVSTTHYKDDSFYDDAEIKENENRKTQMTFWSDWLEKEIV